MANTIVSGNNPSLNQHHTIVFIEMLTHICQSFILNLKTPKINLDGVGEPTINNFYKIDNRKFWICTLNCGRQPEYFISTEVDINTHWLQVSSGTRMVHQQRHICQVEFFLERDFQISKHHFKISQKEN